MINEGHYKHDVSLQRRRFSLLEIYLKIIEESFDFNNIESYKLIPNHEGWEFSAKIGDDVVKVYIYVQPARFGRFELDPKLKKELGPLSEIFNFGFEIGEKKTTDQYAKTTFKDYIRIVATVFQSLLEFIGKNNPNIITFFSESKHGGNEVDLQKDDIYFKVLDKNKPTNYELGKIFDSVDKKTGIMLYRKKL